MGSGVPGRDGGAESGTPFVRVLRAVVCAAVERVAVVTLPVPEPLLSVLAATAAVPVVEARRRPRGRDEGQGFVVGTWTIIFKKQNV